MLLTWLFVTSANGQVVGEPDTTFGVDGVLKVELPYPHDPATLQFAMAPTTSSHFLIVFLYRPIAEEPTWAVATCRVTANGTVDSSYGTDGFTSFSLTRIGDLRLHSALFHTGDNSTFVALNDADSAEIVGMNSTGTKRSNFANQGELTLAGARINGLYEEFVPNQLGGSTPWIGAFGSQSSTGPRQAFWYRQTTSGSASTGNREFVAESDITALLNPSDPADIHAEIHCVTTRADGVRLLIGNAEQEPGVPFGLFAKPVQAGTTLSTAPLRPLAVSLAPGVTPRSINRDAVGELVLHLDRPGPGTDAARLRRSGALDETCLPPLSLFPADPDPTLVENALLFAYTHRGSRYAQVRKQQRLAGGWQLELLRFDWTGNPDLSLNGSGKTTVPLGDHASVIGALPATSHSYKQLLVYGHEPTDQGGPRLVVSKLWLDTAPPVWTNLEVNNVTSELILPPAGSGTLQMNVSNPEGLPGAAIRYYYRDQNGQASDSSLVGSFSLQHDGSRGNPHPRVRQHTLIATDGERTAQRNINVIMQHPPYLSVPLDSRYMIPHGAPLIIRPFMRGASPFQITWNKVNPAGGPPIPVNPILVDPSSATLWFNPIKKTDAGTYQLQFSNPDGVSEVFEVEVEVKNNPSLIAISNSQLVAEGNTVTLWADVFTDAEHVSSRWSKNGQFFHHQTQGATIGFHPVRPADAGIYRATVWTSRGTLVTPAMRLAVVATPVPVQYAATGRQGGLRAAVFGGQNLTFLWLREGQVLLDSDRYRGTATQRLILRNADVADAGRYVFRTLGYGTQVDREIDLVVVTQPPQGTTASLPPTRVGSAYQAQLDFHHGVAKHRVTGLPPGLRLDPISGHISGVPERSGTFTVVAWAENPAGRSPSLRLSLEVSPFPPELVGKYRKSGGFPYNPSLGAFQLQVSSNGSLTGHLPFSIQRISVRGRLTELPDSPGVYETRLQTNPIKAALKQSLPALKVRINGRHLDLHLKEPNINLINGPFPGKFCPPRNDSPFAATYNLAGTATSTPHPSLHGDHSYARVSVSPKGQVRWTGRLSDGTAITASSQLNGDDAVTLHWFNSGSFGVRDLTFTLPTSSPTSRPLAASAIAQWSPLGSDITQIWRGLAYVPPTFSPEHPLLLGAPPVTDNVAASLSSVHYATRSIVATLTAKHRASTGLVTAPDFDRLSNVVFNPRTGLFSGVWIWDDTAADPPNTGLPAKGSRLRLPFSGLIVQPPNADRPRGYGFVPVPISTTIWGGSQYRTVTVKRPAAILLEAR